MDVKPIARLPTFEVQASPESRERNSPKNTKGAGTLQRQKNVGLQSLDLSRLDLAPEQPELGGGQIVDTLRVLQLLTTIPRASINRLKNPFPKKKKRQAMSLTSKKVDREL